jgi:hypothetical protein
MLVPMTAALAAITKLTPLDSGFMALSSFHAVQAFELAPPVLRATRGEDCGRLSPTGRGRMHQIELI